MNQVVEDYFRQKLQKEIREQVQAEMQEKVQERDVQTAINFLINGASVDMVAESIPTLSYDLVVELNKKLHAPVNA